MKVSKFLLKPFSLILALEGATFLVGSQRVPHSWELFLKLMEVGGTKALWNQILQTLAILIPTTVLSLVLSLVMGFLLYRFELITTVAGFYLDFIRAIPAVVLYPLILILLRSSLTALACLIIFTMTLKLLIYVQAGTRGVALELINVARVGRLNKFEIYTKSSCQKMLPKYPLAIDTQRWFLTERLLHSVLHRGFLD